MPILSASFDSLLSEVKKMSDQDRIASIIKISYRNEEEIDGIQKQKRLLIEVLPLSSGGNRKKIFNCKGEFSGRYRKIPVSHH